MNGTSVFTTRQSTHIKQLAFTLCCPFNTPGKVIGNKRHTRYLKFLRDGASLDDDLASGQTLREQEVASLRNELNSEESKLNFLQHSLRIHEVQLKFLKENGVLGNPATDGGGSDSQASLRARLSHEIAEQEKRGKALRERQKDVREKQASLRAQTQQWAHLQTLLRAKMGAITGSYGHPQGTLPGSDSARSDTTSRDWLVL